MKINSVKIILNKFKENLLTEEEAINLIEDIYDDNNRIYYYPYWTYSTNNHPLKYDATCTYENNKMSKM